jgi:lipooligosaccharide transport system permease protein
MPLLSYPAALWIVPFSFLAGFMFATIAVCFAAVAPRIDTLNLPTFLFITPMFLFSGVFFPLEALPGWAQAVANFLPLTHVVRFMRDAALDRVTPRLALDAAWMVVFLLPTLPLGLSLMRRRVIR